MNSTVRSAARSGSCIAAAALLATSIFLAGGCGGGSFPRSTTATDTVAGAGRAAFTIRWPATPTGRLLPLAAQSVTVTLSAAGSNTSIAQKTVARPASGDTTTADFNNLAAGNYVATATAYPNTNGTGVAQAQGTASFTITPAAITDVPLAMGTTVTSVTVLPGQRVITGKTRAVSVSAKDHDGNTVIVSTAALNLAVVDNPTNLSVDSSGNMKGLVAGDATITSTVDGITSSAQSVKIMPPGFLFQTATDYTTTGPDVFAAVDVDGDGNLDIVFAGGVLFGNGDGTFGASANFSIAAGGVGQGIAVDVFGHGRKDLVFCNTNGNRVAVIENLGSRNFADAVYYPVGTKPYSVTAGDFNGDGAMDLATANDGSNDITILKNNGDGTFTTTATFGSGSFPAYIYATDVDGDTKTDLIASNYLNNVVVFKGNGSGSFSLIGNYTAKNESGAFAYGDLDNDGKPDIAIANTFDNSISVYLHQTGGTFTGQTVYSGNVYPAYPTAADMDGDGNQDIVTADNGVSYFSIYPGNGKGALAPPLSFTSTGTNVRTAVVGDFNKDGMPDVAIGNESSGTITVFLNAK